MREATGRALRIAELKKIIELTMQQGKVINKKKLIASLSLKWNVATRKVKEYLDLLLDTDFIVETPDGIKTPAAEEADKILNSSLPENEGKD